LTPVFRIMVPLAMTSKKQGVPPSVLTKPTGTVSPQGPIGTTVSEVPSMYFFSAVTAKRQPGPVTGGAPGAEITTF
jgi:hypothetical protein